MKWIFVIALLILPLLPKAQLITNTSSSPAGLVQNVLLGPGVQVSNITFTGSIQAIGQFTALGTNLGIDSGIVITTGTVFDNGSGPQGPNDDAASGVDNSRPGATILNAISSSTTFNAAILEFDFTAVGDSVSFNYVFGSEEYLEYVDIGNPNAFNDVFGLFISGPLITGNQNIALLPNGQVVSINNVNDILNTGYYVDNGDGNTSPYSSSSMYIQYDGFTKVLTARAKVQCGETYHLTIAIADVGDGILDSGIFLEAQSLESKPLFDTKHKLSQQNFGNDQDVAENCTSVDITVFREDNTVPYSVPVVVNGTATEGADYSNIPPSVDFLVGQDSLTLTIDIFGDNLNEADETIQLIFMIPNECGDIVPDTINLTIRSVLPLQVTLINDTLVCGQGMNTTLTPVVTGGLEPYTYLWSTGATTESINIAPFTTTTYTITVTDDCLNQTASASAEIFVPAIPPVILEPIDDVTSICAFTPVLQQAFASGGSGTYTFKWFENSVLISNLDTVSINPPATSSYVVVATDQCGLEDTVTFNYNILTPILKPSISAPDTICPGDPYILQASATDGLAPYTYIWSHSGETSSTVVVNPSVSTTYTVYISDACSTYALPANTRIYVKNPIANFNTISTDLNTGAQIQFQDASVDGISFSWDFGNGTYSSLQNPSTVYTQVGEYNVTLIMIDKYGCRDTIQKVVQIGHLLFIPNTFTPDGNIHNEAFFAVSQNVRVLEFMIFNRWGEVIYKTGDDTRFKWDGTYNGKPCPDGTYTYKIKYLDPSDKEYVFVGHVNLIR